MTSLLDHLATGATTVARCWRVTRADGVVLGFTDHDRDLVFDETVFAAGAGLSARALSQTTGLAVDNTEAAGALSDAAITEADLLAGRFDGAQVEAWQVNWADVTQRMLEFRGTIGEVAQAGGAFQAELRGLTELLNQPQGRVYQVSCSAILGDGRCGVDLTLGGYFEEREVEEADEGRVFRFADFLGFDDRWFERGRLVVLSGAAAGLVEVIKNDRLSGRARSVELWQAIRAPVVAGDRIRLEAGCDRRAETCRLKFANFLNFRGFPHLPGEDWLAAVPRGGEVNDGGRRTG
ncbi:phage conserved hypothetical protein BR0599 [Gemmobacter megaterium]|uniref:Bacteriophage phiJL001 Gp84 C-terminal domain-containing protein n=1 Tax=Gemmobacter megaterium TaxID=1086013 RepID=A0A1N7LQ91_9RHOB|nr:DUF2163 domain-containing protein [Gemmobacter megaterium]GGE11159.1 hypothetical protein GCM10011345_16410 [Gemmobacter megaterium]SIS76000.1 phage conserved hypothetical protein BR0599 [Gemmobacter megaterium]